MFVLHLPDSALNKFCSHIITKILGIYIPFFLKKYPLHLDFKKNLNVGILVLQIHFGIQAWDSPLHTHRIPELCFIIPLWRIWEACKDLMLPARKILHTQSFKETGQRGSNLWAPLQGAPGFHCFQFRNTFKEANNQTHKSNNWPKASKFREQTSNQRISAKWQAKHN